MTDTSERWREVLAGRQIPPANTESGLPLDLLYTPDHVRDLDYARDLGYPGQPPFTRGVYATMYRTNLWTFRQYAGFGTAEESNERYRYLLKQGQTALSVAFDLPTQLGYDADHPLAEEEVGRVGVSIATVEDMERLFDGIPLDKVSVNFTINATAPMILALYLVAAERRGLSWASLAGTLQNDILKEYLARKTYIYPPEMSLRLIGDVIEFSAANAPRFNPISVTGYHAREAGCTAPQELAFAMAEAITYAQLVLERGLAFDDFAPRLSFHFSTGLDFFEEIAKLRAARRLWSRIATQRFGARDPRSAALRFFSGCSGTCLSEIEPLNNIIRSTIQCLAAVLGGAQSVHVMAYDEPFEIPSEESVLISLRTQQIIARESGIASVVDPLGGSYLVESLTEALEREAGVLLHRIEDMGGIVAGVRTGELQRWIADAAYAHQRAIQTGARPLVGVNVYPSQEQSAPSVPHLFELDTSVRERRIGWLRDMRARRDGAAVATALRALRDRAANGGNLMGALLGAARASVSVAEMADELRAVAGEYREPASV